MKTITLKHPIGDISSFTFRRANTGDFAAADAVTGEFSKTLAVLAGMADTTLPTMKKIDIEDFTAIVDQVGDLMGNAPQPDGSTS